jgi:hypothetical protein
MPSDLIPTSRRNELAPALGSGLAARASRDRQTSRALAQVERQTLVRIASVQGHAMVQTEKLHEIDRLSREAMSGQAMLNRWGATLAQGDAFLADDLKFFLDIAKMGKGEIIADTVSDFCQEGRR